jgi:hypothetical protein
MDDADASARMKARKVDLWLATKGSVTAMKTLPPEGDRELTPTPAFQRVVHGAARSAEREATGADLFSREPRYMAPG